MSDTVVVIPSLNSPLIRQVVAAVLDQEKLSSRPNVTVVGRDEASLIPREESVKFIDTGEPVLAAVSRNRGAMVSDEHLVVFLDSDCIPEPDWLAQHIAAHEAGHRVVSGGVLPAGRNYWHLVYNLTLFHELLSTNPPGPRDFLATLNLSVERDVIEQVGGMDETMSRGEDVEWTTRMRRAGIQPYFWPEAAVWHDHSRDDFAAVWRDCAASGHHMRTVRLRHADLLQAPVFLRYPRLIWTLSPFIAAWATARIFWKRPYLFPRFWRILPGLYLTKIAWCWGASRAGENSLNKGNSD